MILPTCARICFGGKFESEELWALFCKINLLGHTVFNVLSGIQSILDLFILNLVIVLSLVIFLQLINFTVLKILFKLDLI